MAKTRRSRTEPAAPAEPAEPAVEEATPVSEVEPTVAEEREAPEAPDAPDAEAETEVETEGEAEVEDAPEAAPEDASLTDTTDYLKGLIEAILFVADHPVDVKELARAVRIDRKRTQEILQLLREEYQARGVFIDEVAEGFAFRSNPRYSSHVRNFLAQRPVRLSRAQLETLAIIAYRQPITRPEVDDIRGVDCGPVLKGLLERDLVKILGKKDEPGRPLLYGTTQSFLELFSMQSLSQLPTLREFTELSDESRRAFERQIGEEAPEGPIDVEPAAEAAAAEGESPESTSSEQPESTAVEASPEDEDDKEEDKEDEDEDDDDDEDDEDDEDDDDDDDDGDDEDGEEDEESDGDDESDEDDDEDDDDEDDDEDDDDDE